MSAPQTIMRRPIPEHEINLELVPIDDGRFQSRPAPLTQTELAAASVAQRKPVAQMSPTELQHEADAVAVRMEVGTPLMGDSIVVLELANRLARVQPQERAS